ncbi:hypothetical protein RND71_013425 [Anisodus tanguticus]|uniref:Uncharacterized protein n=1 Tax=Anisodus tanguticus TaxID=243964 RepID=A0AAE1SHU1_9SOLA|nr:hypothetical protein RND71_013425 [Anisodus tanguticus]
MAGSSSTDAKAKLIQDLILYAASAALSMAVLFVGLRHLDPNREASKRAIESRKQLSKRLGRTLIHTTPYEFKGLKISPLTKDGNTDYDLYLSSDDYKQKMSDESILGKILWCRGYLRDPEVQVVTTMSEEE